MRSQVEAIDSFGSAPSRSRASHPCRGLRPRSIHRIADAYLAVAGAIEDNRPCLIAIVTIAFCLTSCASVSHHQFSEPVAGWQTKTGQLMYRTAKATLIGEAVVRLSKTGDFELTVSKGPGITLLSLRQDAEFAEFNATFTGQHWSGPTASAPPQLRGWLALRDQFLRAPNQKMLRYVGGSGTFVFRF
jgi:hypothetical protein